MVLKRQWVSMREKRFLFAIFCCYPKLCVCLLASSACLYSVVPVLHVYGQPAEDMGEEEKTRFNLRSLLKAKGNRSWFIILAETDQAFWRWFGLVIKMLPCLLPPYLTTMTKLWRELETLVLLDFKRSKPSPNIVPRLCHHSGGLLQTYEEKQQKTAMWGSSFKTTIDFIGKCVFLAHAEMIRWRPPQWANIASDYSRIIRRGHTAKMIIHLTSCWSPQIYISLKPLKSLTSFLCSSSIRNIFRLSEAHICCPSLLPLGVKKQKSRHV